MLTDVRHHCSFLDQLVELVRSVVVFRLGGAFLDCHKVPRKLNFTDCVFQLTFPHLPEGTSSKLANQLYCTPHNLTRPLLLIVMVRLLIITTEWRFGDVVCKSLPLEGIDATFTGHNTKHVFLFGTFPKYPSVLDLVILHGIRPVADMREFVRLLNEKWNKLAALF